MSLLSIPEELLSQIICLLDPLSFFRARAVSSELYSVAASSYLCSALLREHFPLAHYRASLSNSDVEYEKALALLASSYRSIQTGSARRYFQISLEGPPEPVVHSSRRKSRFGEGCLALYYSGTKNAVVIRLADQAKWTLSLPRPFVIRDLHIGGGKIAVLTTRLSMQQIFVYDLDPSCAVPVNTIATYSSDLVSIRSNGTIFVCASLNADFYVYAPQSPLSDTENAPSARLPSSIWRQHILTPFEDVPIDIIFDPVPYDIDCKYLYLISKRSDVRVVAIYSLTSIWPDPPSLIQTHLFPAALLLSMFRLDHAVGSCATLMTSIDVSRTPSFHPAIYLVAQPLPSAHDISDLIAPRVHLLHGPSLSPPHPLPAQDYIRSGLWAFTSHPELAVVVTWEGSEDANFGLFTYSVPCSRETVDHGRLRGAGEEEEQSEETQVNVWMGNREDGKGMWVVAVQERRLLVWSLGGRIDTPLPDLHS